MEILNLHYPYTNTLNTRHIAAKIHQVNQEPGVSLWELYIIFYCSGHKIHMNLIPLESKQTNATSTIPSSSYGS